MEFWVVVAAAGAGYVTQYLQNSSGNNDNLLDQDKFSEISSHEQSENQNLLYKLLENFCPFRRLARKRAQYEVLDEGIFGFRHLNLDSSGKLPCTDCCTDDEKSKTRCSGPFNSTGLPNEMALLYMGITTGMMSAFITNRKEIEKLNDKLNMTKNLVEELQDEIEKKEEFIMKSLANEKPNLFSPSKSTVLPMSMPMSVSSCSDIQVDESTTQPGENTIQFEAVNHESSMSEIEAELEAELERLEMNMKASNFERMCGFVEVDQEDEVDMARGDLKLDCHNVQCPGSSESDWDSSRTEIDQVKPVEYPVSPMELSLRLHEVIESRLEAQIRELEIALYNNLVRGCSMEGKHVLSPVDCASNQSETSAFSHSPYRWSSDQ